MCTPLPVRSPLRLVRRLANRVSCFQPDIHEGIIILSIRVGSTHSKKAGLLIKTRRLFCHGPLYGSMHMGQGTSLRSLYEY